MDKKNLMELMEAMAENRGTKAEMVRIETWDKAIAHAEWAAMLKPGDRVKHTSEGIVVVSPEGVEGNRINLFYMDEEEDGTYTIGCMLSPISAIMPVD